MITKEVFVQTMLQLQELDEKYNKIDSALRELDSNFCQFYPLEPFNIVVNLLEEIFQDNDYNLSYFVYDSNWLEGCKNGKNSIFDANNKDITPKSWEEVYDFLVENMKESGEKE